MVVGPGGVFFSYPERYNGGLGSSNVEYVCGVRGGERRKTKRWKRMPKRNSFSKNESKKGEMREREREREGESGGE